MSRIADPIRPPDSLCRLDSRSPLAHRLVACYDPLASRSGVPWRELCNGLHAQPANNARVLRDPELGWAFSFDPDTSDHATAAGARFNFGLSSRFTVTAWVRAQGAADSTLVSHTGDIVMRGWQFRLTPYGEEMRVYLGLFETDYSYISRSGAINLADNRWHHVAAVYAGVPTEDALRVYVDGIEDPGGFESESSPSFVNCDAPLRLGSRYGDGYFRGRLGPITVHDDALTPDLIRHAADPRHRWTLLATPRRRAVRAGADDALAAAATLRTFTRVSSRARVSLVGEARLASSASAAASGERVRPVFAVDFHAQGWSEFPAPPTSTGPGAVMTQSPAAAHPDEPVTIAEPVAAGPRGALVQLAPGGDTVFVERPLPAPSNRLHTRVAVDAGGLAAGQAAVMQGIDAEGRVVFTLAVTAASIGLGVTGEEPVVVTPADVSPWHDVEIVVDRGARMIELWIDGQRRGVIEPADAIPPIARLRLGAPARSGDAAGTVMLSRWSVGDARLGPSVRPTARPATLADAARWLVVYNRNDADSVAWARAYRAARGLPLANLVGLDLPTTEHASHADADKIIHALHEAMADHPPGDVRGVVLGHRVPAFVAGTPIETRFAPIPPCDESKTGDERGSLLRRSGLLVARIDGGTLCDADAVTARALAIADAPSANTDSVVLAAPAEGFEAWRAWGESRSARRLHLTIDTRDALPSPPSAGLTTDAFVVASVSGTLVEPAAFAGRAGMRVLAVFVPTADGLPTLRGDASWAGAALGAGYAAALMATRPNVPRIGLGVLFESLRRGWTLAEAFAAALPPAAKPGDWQFLGDPMLTFRAPAAGWRVLGPVGLLESLDADADAIELNANERAVALPADARPANTHAARWLVRHLDPMGRSEAGVACARALAVDGVARTMPLPPIFPTHEGWLVARRGDVASPYLAMDRPFAAARVTQVECLARGVDDNESVIARIVPPAGAVSLSRDFTLDVTATRFAFRLLTAEGVGETTPWSAPVAPAPLPDVPLTILET